MGSMLCNFLVFCVVFFICLSPLCALGFLSLECPFSNIRSVPVACLSGLFILDSSLVPCPFGLL